eukprot:GFUD01030214.1.p1 GENE.GFUD01030214.1~~GFUD01030214.1.p1  ORF type:complete len:181 (-),score=53.32 GFUD01030214.1:650-1192(-)
MDMSGHNHHHHLPGVILTTILVSGTILMSGTVTATASFCPVEGSDYYDKPEGKITKEFFECPGPDDPPDHTVCCEQNCCPVRHIDSVLRVDIRVAMAISITVIIISITTGITLIICCFWSNCPLYDTCAGGYKRQSILPFGEYDGSDTDLLTSNGHAKHNPKYYSTASDVKIKVTKADHV